MPKEILIMHEIAIWAFERTMPVLRSKPNIANKTMCTKPPPIPPKFAKAIIREKMKTAAISMARAGKIFRCLQMFIVVQNSKGSLQSVSASQGLPIFGY